MLPSADSSSSTARCLNESHLLAFAAGELSGEACEALDAHIDCCTRCRELLWVAMGAAPHYTHKTPVFEPGHVVCGRYQILSLLGCGGMGQVYAALDQSLNETVALKCLSPELAMHPRAVAALKSELQLARRVTHPNVCRVFDLGADRVAGAAPVHFLTMQLLQGETLGARVRRGPLPLRECPPLARQLLLALQAAHDVSVLHRDFKSDNVILLAANTGSQCTRAVVTDFGLARAFRAGQDHVSNSQPLVGSAAYLAPEQLHTGQLTERTDLYSFGVVLFEMLTGTLPFLGDSALLTATMRLTQPAPPPSTRRVELSVGWDQFVARCLERDPQLRYPSATAALQALDELTSAPLTQARARPSESRPRPHLLLLACFALCTRDGSAGRRLAAPNTRSSSAPSQLNMTPPSAAASSVDAPRAAPIHEAPPRPPQARPHQVEPKRTRPQRRTRPQSSAQPAPPPNPLPDARHESDEPEDLIDPFEQ